MTAAPFTAADLAKCAEREVRMRRLVYPRWTADGRLKQETADREIAMMEAIAARLRAEAEDLETKGRLV